MNPDQFPRTRLGRTDLNVSRLALGTVELGVDYGIQAPGQFGRPPESDAIRLVHAALEAGINFIDTARAYGTSESVLGKALKNRRAQAILATKVATQPPPDTTLTPSNLRRSMIESLEESLRALETDYVDIWQIHNVDPETLDNIEVVTEVFEQVKRAGKVRWCGGSFYGNELPVSALKIDVFDTMQVTYSILDQRLAEQTLPLASQQQVGVVARSVLLKGVLTNRADYLPERLGKLRDHANWYHHLVQEIEGQPTSAQVAIAFALAHPQINAVLIGVRTEQELHENLRALDLQLSENTLNQLGALRLEDDQLLNPSTWGIP